MSSQISGLGSWILEEHDNEAKPHQRGHHDKAHVPGGDLGDDSPPDLREIELTACGDGHGDRVRAIGAWMNHSTAPAE